MTGLIPLAFALVATGAAIEMLRTGLPQRSPVPVRATAPAAAERLARHRDSDRHDSDRHGTAQHGRTQHGTRQAA